jgi:hypothetical protein
MTQCTQSTIPFASLKTPRAKRIEADFAGGRLTSDAGALLLREADKRLGLTDTLARCIPDPRDPRFTVHEQQEMLAQRIYAIALGYEDLNDHDTLRHDVALQVAAERIRETEEDQALSSSPTLCRLENRIDRKAMARIAERFVDIFIASYQEPPKEIVLDFDATDDPLHGQQEGRFFHGYYDCYCYLPLYVFCGDQLLVPYLRPSNIDAALHSRAILKLIVRHLRRVWPEVRITVRADSGFCRWKFMRWCDTHEVSYILGLARNKVLERMAAPWMAEAEAAFEETGQKQRHFAEVQYAAQTWDRERRVVVKAERLPQGPNLRFVVTNLPGDPQALYDDLYCKRGDMENRIKEQQLALFADRTSCHAFSSNQFRLLLSSAAYILIDAIRRVGLQNTPLERAQVDTIRLKLFKIGARVMCSVRRIVFHLASGYPLQQLLRQVVSRLRVAQSPAFEFG